MGFRIMNRNRQMGIAEFCLLIFISLSFVSPTFSLHKALSSGQKHQESKFKEGKGLHAYRVAKGGGSGGHGSGHTSPHNGENGGGESRTPTQGGAAVIPAYVAGAAHGNDRSHHHGSNSSGGLNRIELPTLLLITFIYTPLLHMCLSI